MRGSDLRDVQFAEVDAVTGRAQRRVFADSARIRIRPSGGVELQFEGGSVRRGTRVAPFLAGKYRIVLPRARAEDWREVSLPGLAAPPVRPASDSKEPASDSKEPASDSKEIVEEPVAPVR